MRTKVLTTNLEKLLFRNIIKYLNRVFYEFLSLFYFIELTLKLYFYLNIIIDENLAVLTKMRYRPIAPSILQSPNLKSQISPF